MLSLRDFAKTLEFSNLHLIKKSSRILGLYSANNDWGEDIMTDREFAFVVSIYRSILPDVTSRNIEAVTRDFKAACDAWSIHIDATKMSQLPGLLSMPRKIKLHGANKANAHKSITVDAEHIVDAEQGLFVDTDVPVAAAGPGGLSLGD